jgi:hypothetical protein
VARAAAEPSSRVGVGYPLDGQHQIGCALNLIERHSPGPGDKIVRSPFRLIEDVEIVEREVEAIAHRGKISNECALAVCRAPVTTTTGIVSAALRSGDWRARGRGSLPFI